MRLVASPSSSWPFTWPSWIWSLAPQNPQSFGPGGGVAFALYLKALSVTGIRFAMFQPLNRQFFLCPRRIIPASAAPVTMSQVAGVWQKVEPSAAVFKSWYQAQATVGIVPMYRGPIS